MYVSPDAPTAMSSTDRVVAAWLGIVVVLAVAPGGAAASDLSDGREMQDGNPAPALYGESGDDNASFIHDGDAITLHPGPGQVIKGTARAPPGTNVTVRLQSTDSAAPFLMVERVTVTPDGRFAAAFDLGGLVTPATATVRVGGDRTGSSAPVEIVPEPATTGTTPGPTTTAVRTSRPATATSTPETTPTSVPGFGIVIGGVAMLLGLYARRGPR